MKTYGQTETTDIVGILSDLRWYVSLVGQLPDPTDDYENVTFVLEKPQQGYIATHVYRCVRNESSVLYWKDLSSPESILCDSTCSAIGRNIVDANEVDQLQIAWDGVSDRAMDKWVADLLVIKEDEAPTCLTDGRLVVCSKVRGEYSFSKSSVSSGDGFVTAFLTDYTNQATSKARIFHLYQSGQMTYTDPVMNADSYCGVVGSWTKMNWTYSTSSGTCTASNNSLGMVWSLMSDIGASKINVIVARKNNVAPTWAEVSAKSAGVTILAENKTLKYGTSNNKRGMAYDTLFQYNAAVLVQNIATESTYKYRVFYDITMTSGAKYVWYGDLAYVLDYQWIYDVVQAGLHTTIFPVTNYYNTSWKGGTLHSSYRASGFTAPAGNTAWVLASSDRPEDLGFGHILGNRGGLAFAHKLTSVPPSSEVSLNTYDYVTNNLYSDNGCHIADYTSVPPLYKEYSATKVSGKAGITDSDHWAVVCIMRKGSSISTSGAEAHTGPRPLAFDD